MSAKPGNAVGSLLERAGRWLALAAAARAGEIVLTAMLLSALTAIVLDAIFAFAAAGLIALDVILTAALAAGLVYVVRRGWAQRGNPRRAARVLEERLGLGNSRLINSVDFSKGVPASCSGELAETEIRAADALAVSLAPRAIVDGGPLRRGGQAVIGACAAALLLMLLPGLYQAVLPRFLHPQADLPPFTLLKFEVTTEPGRIYANRPALIRATITGPETPDHADVVFVENDRHGQPQRMLRDEDGRYFFQIDRAQGSQEFFIDTPRGRSRRYTLAVDTAPLFEKTEVRYEYPAYTQWPAVTRELRAGGIAALEGSTVTLTIHSNTPLRWGSLFLSPDKQTTPPIGMIPMAPLTDDKTVVMAQFPLTFSGWFSVQLIGVDGVPSDTMLDWPIRAIPDKPPEVEITQPDSYLIAPPDWKLAVTVAARDDIAVSRILLSRAINGRPPVQTELQLQHEGPTFAKASAAMYLQGLNAVPGDLITYFATAYDNKPPNGQFTDSSMNTVEVVSEQDYVNYVRSQYQMDQVTAEAADFQSRLQKLQDEQVRLQKELAALKQKLASGGQPDAATQQRMKDDEESLQEFRGKAEDLADEMHQRVAQKQVYDFEKPYTDMLRSAAKELEDAAKQADDVAEASRQMQQSSGDSAAARALAGAIDRFEPKGAKPDAAKKAKQVVEDLEKLRLADALVAQAERIEAVIGNQRELADRMGHIGQEQIISAADQIRLAQLAEEQEALRGELADATAELAKAAKAGAYALPKMSGSAAKLCDAIGKMGVDADQKLAAQSMRINERPTSLAMSRRAAEKLESLQSSCDCEGGNESDLDGCLSLPRDRMKNSLGQLSKGRQMPGLSSGLAGNRSGMGQSQGSDSMRGTVAGLYRAADSDREGGKGPGRGHGSSLWGVNSTDALAEYLTATPDTNRQAGAMGMQGVPAPYREQAEAYFERIAQESQQDRPENSQKPPR